MAVAWLAFQTFVGFLAEAQSGSPDSVILSMSVSSPVALPPSTQIPFQILIDPTLVDAAPIPTSTQASVSPATATSVLPETLTLSPTLQTLLTAVTNDDPVAPVKRQSQDRWIDVDLSAQRLDAFQGDQMLKSFDVSTGRKWTPTVIGKYRIYVKYRHADMAGPGYYLPAVPFVMYFFKDYGLHGTYWHDNFGTPMSHGCVNLRTEDAAWLFRWASVGTTVNIHR